MIRNSTNIKEPNNYLSCCTNTFAIIIYHTNITLGPVHYEANFYEY